MADSVWQKGSLCVTLSHTLIHTHTHTHTHTHAHTHTHTHTHTGSTPAARTPVSTSPCAMERHPTPKYIYYVYMYMYMYCMIYIYIFIYIHLYIYIYWRKFQTSLRSLMNKTIWRSDLWEWTQARAHTRSGSPCMCSTRCYGRIVFFYSKRATQTLNPQP